MPQPDLSLCLIIRDEQEMLPGFLNSTAGLWDEMVAVDTGSTDDSVRLLEAAGARVIPFTWIDDFSAARNASLEAARGRWILFLDADERPTGELIREIRALLNDPTAGAATLIMRNEWPDGTRQDAPLLRLFRNDPAIRFEHRIHEDVSTSVRDHLQTNNLRLRHLNGVVIHLGYSKEVASGRDKKTRDLELLYRSLESDPEDFYCWFKILEIARFWNDRPLWESKAKEVAGLLEQITPRDRDDLLQRPFSGELAALVAQGLPIDDKDRLRWLEESRNFAKTTGPWYLRKGLILENLTRFKDAATAYNACLTQDSPSDNRRIAIRAHLGLCRLAVAESSPPLALDHIRQACHLGPRDAEALLAALTILPLVDPDGQPDRFVEQHLHDHPDVIPDLGRALVSTGHVKTAARILESPAEKQADAALGFLVCCLALNRELDLQVDTDQETADRLFKEWIRLLWQSRRTEVMEVFADSCSSVQGIFPWLPEFLREETRRLQS